MFSSAAAKKPDFILPKMYFEFPHKATFELRVNERKIKSKRKKIIYIFKDCQIKSKQLVRRFRKQTNKTKP